MAITFHQQPQSFTPSDNDVLWLFSSNQTAQSNFEFKVELRINTILVFTGKLFPIQGSNAYFNATEILRGLVPAAQINSSPDTISDLDELQFFNSSARLVNLTVIERFGNPVADGASANTNTRVWKAACSELKFISLNTNQYILGSTIDRLFLTNFPREQKYYVDPNKNAYFSILNNSTTDEVLLRWETLDDSDSYNWGALPVNAIFVNFNMSKINGVLGTNFEQFAAIQFIDQSLLPGIEPRSEKFRVEIATCIDEDRTVYFLNKLGGVDQWLFTKKKEVDRNFKRSEFKKKLGFLEGNSYVYDSFVGRGQNFHNESTEVMKLDSDWLHPDVHAWLVRELLESPLVWMEDENGIKTRYLIKNASSDEGQEKYDVWKTLSLEMKPTLQSYSATL